MSGKGAGQTLTALLLQRGGCGGQSTEIAACPRSIGSDDRIAEPVLVLRIHHPSSPSLAQYFSDGPRRRKGQHGAPHSEIFELLGRDENPKTIPEIATNEQARAEG